MPHISLAAEKIWTYMGFPITNSLLTTWFVMAILFILAYVSTRKMTNVPSRIQVTAELVIGGLYDFFKGVAGEHVKRVFPLLASIFLFVIVANWAGLLPGVGTIGFFRTAKHVAEQPVGTEQETVVVSEGEAAVHEEVATEEVVTEEETEFVPLLRGPTADLNTTLALALVSVLAIQYYGFTVIGPKYGARFIDLRSPIFFFVGVLEILSDVSKILSFAFRLFGNIFAGEVLLAVMAFLMPFIVPLPFLTLELFVGFVQALVFSMLTAVFISVSLSHGEGEHQEAHAHV
jgi:F-type H+-transporting ATPase subunit a